MTKPILNRPFGDESRLAQIRYWQNIGGYGISPEMLALTGFWNDGVLNEMRNKNIDTYQSVHQLYGGIIRFQPLPGKKWEEKFDKIMDILNTILQIKRHIDSTLDMIHNFLNEKWHEDDYKFLPSDMEEGKKKEIMRSSRYNIAEDPQTARQMLSIVPVLKSIRNSPPYWAEIYREANTIFGRMALESVSLSLRNLSIKDTMPPQISLEELADHAADVIIEG